MMGALWCDSWVEVRAVVRHIEVDLGKIFVNAGQPDLKIRPISFVSFLLLTNIPNIGSQAHVSP